MSQLPTSPFPKRGTSGPGNVFIYNIYICYIHIFPTKINGTISDLRTKI